MAEDKPAEQVHYYQDIVLPPILLTLQHNVVHLKPLKQVMLENVLKS